VHITDVPYAVDQEDLLEKLVFAEFVLGRLLPKASCQVLLNQVGKAKTFLTKLYQRILRRFQMASSDPIADMLTIIRNGGKAGFVKVDIPGSKIKLEMVRVLKEQGYIKDFKFLENETQGSIRVYIKYVSEGQPTIFGIERVSKPSCRVYYKSKQLKPVLNGLGISIVSTSKGLMTDKQAKEANVGGEILCNVW